MDTPTPLFKNKKVLVLMGIILLFVIIVILFLTSQKTAAPNSSSQKPTPMLTPKNSDLNNTNTLQSYKNTDYQIQYPNNLSEVHLSNSQLFKPNDLKDTSFLGIAKIPDSSAYLPYFRNIMKAKNLTKTAVTIKGQSAEKYSGTTKNEERNMTIQTSNFVIQKGNIAYIISYSYDGAVVDANKENYFSKIIATFQLF